MADTVKDQKLKSLGKILDISKKVTGLMGDGNAATKEYRRFGFLPGGDQALTESDLQGTPFEGLSLVKIYHALLSLWVLDSIMTDKKLSDLIQDPLSEEYAFLNSMPGTDLKLADHLTRVVI